MEGAQGATNRSGNGNGTVRVSEVVWKNDDGKERDKRGQIIKVCGIDGCTYKTGITANMKNHKAAKHNIDVVWHTCPNCDYKAKQKCSITKHLRLNRCPGKK
mmetsp:Transcript_14090/g.28763  ORF Transcript_14090/g.28763 Transcript_14090/m.28763 type:complete len:102 (+) Transcript_14090:231-536(+)